MRLFLKSIKNKKGKYMVREELLPGGPAWLNAAVGSEFTPPAASAPAPDGHINGGWTGSWGNLCFITLSVVFVSSLVAHK